MLKCTDPPSSQKLKKPPRIAEAFWILSKTLLRSKPSYSRAHSHTPVAAKPPAPFKRNPSKWGQFPCRNIIVRRGGWRMAAPERMEMISEADDSKAEMVVISAADSTFSSSRCVCLLCSGQKSGLAAGRGSGLLNQNV